MVKCKLNWLRGSGWKGGRSRVGMWVTKKGRIHWLWVPLVNQSMDHIIQWSSSLWQVTFNHFQPSSTLDKGLPDRFMLNLNRNWIGKIFKEEECRTRHLRYLECHWIKRVFVLAIIIMQFRMHLFNGKALFEFDTFCHLIRSSRAALMHLLFPNWTFPMRRIWLIISFIDLISSDHNKWTLTCWKWLSAELQEGGRRRDNTAEISFLWLWHEFCFAVVLLHFFCTEEIMVSICDIYGLRTRQCSQSLSLYSK